MEILLHLYLMGGTSSHKLMGVSRLSAAGFHIVRRRLCDRGLIEGAKSDDDSRKVVYDVAPKVREQFDAFMMVLAGEISKSPSSIVSGRSGQKALAKEQGAGSTA